MPATSVTTASLDAHLSKGRFGDGGALARNMEALYDGLLHVLRQSIECDVPAPHNVKELPKQVIIRRSIDMAFAALSTGNLEGAKRALQVIEALNICTDSAKQAVVGPITVFTNIKTDRCAAAIFNSFVQSMKEEGIVVRETSIGAHELAMVRASVKLLERVLPGITKETLSLAPGMVVVESPVKSAYINENPYCFMTSNSQFRDEPRLAETILHESLHQKMVDIRLSNNLLREGYDDLASEERGDVLVPWPDKAIPRSWSAARALAAHHVYVHISLFYFSLLEGTTTLSAEVVEHRLRVSSERARYLADALLELQPSPWGEDGVEMLSWLDQPLCAVCRHPSLKHIAVVLDDWRLAVKRKRMLSC